MSFNPKHTEPARHRFEGRQCATAHLPEARSGGFRHPNESGFGRFGESLNP